jgi:glycosyltransferase involved in cell wall biosynthesis
MPLISLLLPVKNGWPHLKTTIDAVRRQTCKDYELIIQDGGSTDGTLDYLQSLRGIPNLAIASAPDRGIGQAYNRALTRSSGDLVCFIAADEYLEDDSLERGVSWCHEHPSAVVVNGAVRLTNAHDEVIQIFEAPAFDLLGHLRCEAVLPFAGLLNRRRLGQDLFYDESLETCPDYEFWIRVGSRFASADFVSMKEVFKTARADRTSMSFRAESFDRFCRDKLFALERYLASRPSGLEVDSIRRSATAGIYLWAAESVFFLEGVSRSFMKWCEAAAHVVPSSPRLQRLARRSGAFTIDANTGVFRGRTAIQPAEPPVDARVLAGGVFLERIQTHAHWIGAAVDAGPIPRVQTPEGPWEYAAEIPLALTDGFDDRCWYWIALELEVRAGQVGVALMLGSDIAHEQIVSTVEGRKVIFIAVSADRATAIVIRNGGLRQRSTADVLSASVVACPIAPTDVATASSAPH